MIYRYAVRITYPVCTLVLATVHQLARCVIFALHYNIVNTPVQCISPCAILHLLSSAAYMTLCYVRYGISATRLILRLHVQQLA